VEITVRVWQEEDTYIASWDDPSGGGLTTQGETLRELLDMVEEAAELYFFEKGRKRPVRVRLHFIKDPVLA
jgi:predicted RNase H-like HicB family nuclease